MTIADLERLDADIAYLLRFVDRLRELRNDMATQIAEESMARGDPPYGPSLDTLRAWWDRLVYFPVDWAWKLDPKLAGMDQSTHDWLMSLEAPPTTTMRRA